MRRFLMLLVACSLGLGAALLLAWLMTTVMPCSGEQLACTMDGIAGMAASLIYAGAALLVFGIAVFWKGHSAAVTIGMLALVVAALGFFGYLFFAQIAVREYHDIRDSDIRHVFQIFIPALLTAVVPWLLLLTYIRRAQG